MGRKTPIYEYHRKHGNIVEYAGFDLPVWFEGIVPECRAVRAHAGIFDVSHMGRVIVEGPDAETLLDHLTTNSVSALSIGRGQYSLLCNSHGGIIDDITVFRLGDTKFLVVYNAANRDKDWKWLQSHLARHKVTLSDMSDVVAMYAVQGPRAGGLLRDVCGLRLDEVERYGTANVTVGDVPCLITHSGYTGEDGFEIYVWNTGVQDPARALKVWDMLLSNGRESGLRAAGLGARDVLRLEAGMCLYGNELGEDTSPVEARLGWVVSMGKDRFSGKDMIVKMKQAGPSRVRVGFRMREKGIPRQGQEITCDGEVVGKVTSGTFSPTLEIGIGMGFVRPACSSAGERIGIRIRGREVAAVVVRLPFYQRRSPDGVVVFGEEMGLKEFRSKYGGMERAQ